MIKSQLDKLQERDIKVQNPRDLQMALNLIYLSKMYPNKKIIGWGASYHFANQIELWENTSLTKQYAEVMDKIQHSHEPTDLNEALDGAVPMGRILKQYFGSSLYSLGFSSFEGTFGMVGHAPMSLEKVQPPQGSIERELVAADNQQAISQFQHEYKSKILLIGTG
jgi:erythromycin esterase-like protein